MPAGRRGAPAQRAAFLLQAIIRALETNRLGSVDVSSIHDQPAVPYDALIARGAVVAGPSPEEAQPPVIERGHAGGRHDLRAAQQLDHLDRSRSIDLHLDDHRFPGRELTLAAHRDAADLDPQPDPLTGGAVAAPGLERLPDRRARRFRGIQTGHAAPAVARQSPPGVTGTGAAHHPVRAGGHADLVPTPDRLQHEPVGGPVRRVDLEQRLQLRRVPRKIGRTAACVEVEEHLGAGEPPVQVPSLHGIRGRVGRPVAEEPPRARQRGAPAAEDQIAVAAVGGQGAPLAAQERHEASVVVPASRDPLHLLPALGGHVVVVCLLRSELQTGHVAGEREVVVEGVEAAAGVALAGMQVPPQQPLRRRGGVHVYRIGCRAEPARTRAQHGPAGFAEADGNAPRPGERGRPGRTDARCRPSVAHRELRRLRQRGRVAEAIGGSNRSPRLPADDSVGRDDHAEHGERARTHGDGRRVDHLAPVGAGLLLRHDQKASGQRRARRSLPTGTGHHHRSVRGQRAAGDRHLDSVVPGVEAADAAIAGFDLRGRRLGACAQVFGALGIRYLEIAEIERPAPRDRDPATLRQPALADRDLEHRRDRCPGRYRLRASQPRAAHGAFPHRGCQLGLMMDDVLARLPAAQQHARTQPSRAAS